MKPFFPPLEHLQSLNLRAALFRCLDQAKKMGLLGRDAVLRKTMLDECKGERLEEVLAVFSTAVLKKVIQERTEGNHTVITERLAMENVSYNGERSNLSTMIMAHKSSLNRSLATKKEFKARYDDFADLLNLRERQTARRYEQLKVSVGGDSASAISDGEARNLRDRVEKNWTGSTEWLETILHGDHGDQRESLLTTPFDNVWKHVEDGSIGDIEYEERKGLLEQLDARIRQQSHRLEKWQSFERMLTKDGYKTLGEKAPELKKRKIGIDLGFTVHETVQLIRSPLKTAKSQKPASLGDYARLIESMQGELAEVGKPRPGGSKPIRKNEAFRKDSDDTLLLPVTPREAPSTSEQKHYSVSNYDTDEVSPSSENNAAKSVSQTPPSEHAADGEQGQSQAPSICSTEENDNEQFDGPVDMIATTRQASMYSEISPSPPSRTTSPLASEILASVLTTSPSPTKPRHVLSLAERTRLSMSRASFAKANFLSEDTDDDLPELPSHSLQQNSKRSSKSETGQHTDAVELNSSARTTNPTEDLIARTRLSMSNFAAVQKNAQVDRRRSIRAAARNKRLSYLPKPLETAVEDDGVVIDGLDKRKLIQGEVDVDYEVVFKSRPKIKTSPERSPQRSPIKAWGEMGGRGDMGGSSSPMSEGY